jgi:hypothetical protein
LGERGTAATALSKESLDMIRTKEQIERRITRLLDDKLRLEAQLRAVESQIRSERLRLSRL